mmetsp:Transcript_6636/g.25611  ORF Transcript_6636/g.25611 Transcript_6636/m.25611 type:complete len:122 (-) Transcript_6636:1344-1709(-)
MEPCPSAPDLDGSDASQAPEELEDEDSDDLGVLAIAGGVGVGLASAIFGGAVAGPAGALMGINLGRYAGVGLAAAKVVRFWGAWCEASSDLSCSSGVRLGEYGRRRSGGGLSQCAESGGDA